MRVVKLLIALIVITVIGLLLYKVIINVNQKADVEERVSLLPSFTFYKLNNATFTNDSLQKQNSTVIIYFNTNCEHCQYETEQIIKHADELQMANFLMVSIQDSKELKSFDSTYNISHYPFIKLLHDKDNVMNQTFGANTVPTIFIYDENRRLVKKYTGEVKIEAVINAIQ